LKAINVSTRNIAHMLFIFLVKMRNTIKEFKSCFSSLVVSHVEVFFFFTRFTNY
jgi:hypothetical protein